MGWVRKADSLYDHHAGVMFEHEGFIYYLCHSGWEGSALTLKCERYDTAADEWEALPDAPTFGSASETQFTGRVWDGKAYVVGGSYAKIVVRVFNLATLTWEPYNAAYDAPWSSSWGVWADAQDGSSMYVYDSDNATSTMKLRKFQMDTRVWSTVSTSPDATRPVSVGFFLDPAPGPRFIGGEGDPENVLHDVFNISTPGWSQGPQIPGGVKHAAVCQINAAKVWVVAIDREDGADNDGWYEWDEATTSWRAIGEPFGRGPEDDPAGAQYLGARGCSVGMDLLALTDGRPYVHSGWTYDPAGTWPTNVSLRELWMWDGPLPEPSDGAPFEHADLAKGTPAHVIIAKDGRSAQPIIANWTGYEEANGGLVAAAGRIRQSDVDAAEDVLREQSTWRTVARETGEVIWQGRVKEPGGGSGVVDLSADGVGRFIPATEFDAYLVASDDYSLWQLLRDDPVNLHDAPDEGPDGYTINGGTGDLGLGNYRYAVSYVTAESESGLGPDVEISVLIGEEPADIHLRHIPTGGPAVTARKIYRHDPGMGAEEFRLLATLADNTTETYDDSTASVSGNALALDDVNAGQIGTSVEDGGLLFHVEEDAYVLTSQRGGFIWPVRGADARGIRLVVRQNRSLDNWELRIASAEDPRGPWTHEITVDLTGSRSKRVLEEFTNNGELDNLRIELRRKTSGADADPVEVLLQRVMVYGAAPVGDEEFSTSAVMRDGCKRLGVSDAFVRASGLPAGAQLFVDSNWSAVFDLQALLTGWRWLFLVDGDNVVLDFGPSSVRRWLLTDPEVEPDLLPQPRYSRVKLFDDRGRFLAQATANPNLLEERRTKKIRLPFRISVEVAQVLAQRLADHLVKRHWAGSFIIPRVYDTTGAPASHLHVHAGDEFWVPKLQAWVTPDVMEHGVDISLGTVNPGLPLLDRFIARISQERDSTAA